MVSPYVSEFVNMWASMAKQGHANTRPIYMVMLLTLEGRVGPRLCPSHSNIWAWCWHVLVWLRRPGYLKHPKPGGGVYIYMLSPYILVSFQIWGPPMPNKDIAMESTMS